MRHPRAPPRQREPVEKVAPQVFGSFRASCVGVRVCERGANISVQTKEYRGSLYSLVQTVGWGLGSRGRRGSIQPATNPIPMWCHANAGVCNWSCRFIGQVNPSPRPQARGNVRTCFALGLFHNRRCTLLLPMGTRNTTLRTIKLVLSPPLHALLSFNLYNEG